MPRTEIPYNFCFTAKNMRNPKFIAYGRIESKVWNIDFCTLPTHRIRKKNIHLEVVSPSPFPNITLTLLNEQ